MAVQSHSHQACCGTGEEDNHSRPAKITFERILVPTDLSDVSQRAVEYAKSIARQCGSKILLTHVNQPVNPIIPPEGAWFDQEAAQQQIEQQLEDNGAELRSEGFQARTISVTGAIQDEVLSSASRENADLIVIGTHGSTGVERLLFGSDAEDLLRHATCPVIVIGPAAQRPDDQLWHPKRVICATDLDPSNASIAAYAYVLAFQYQATFTLFHVENPTRESKSSDLPQFEKTLAQLLPDAQPPIHALRNELSDRFPGLAISDFAEEKQADLIVMGAHTASIGITHLLQGIVPQVFTEAPCPVMVLHQ